MTCEWGRPSVHAPPGSTCPGGDASQRTTAAAWDRLCRRQAFAVSPACRTRRPRSATRDSARTDVRWHAASAKTARHVYVQACRAELHGSRDARQAGRLRHRRAWSLVTGKIDRRPGDQCSQHRPALRTFRSRPHDANAPRQDRRGTHARGVRCFGLRDSTISFAGHPLSGSYDGNAVAPGPSTYGIRCSWIVAHRDVHAAAAASRVISLMQATAPASSELFADVGSQSCELAARIRTCHFAGPQATRKGCRAMCHRAGRLVRSYVPRSPAGARSSDACATSRRQAGIMGDWAATAWVIDAPSPHPLASCRARGGITRQAAALSARR